MGRAMGGGCGQERDGGERGCGEREGVCGVSGSGMRGQAQVERAEGRDADCASDLDGGRADAAEVGCVLDGDGLGQVRDHGAEQDPRRVGGLGVWDFVQDQCSHRMSRSSGVCRQFGINEIVITVAAGRSRIMSSGRSNVSPRQDTVWWYGGLMEIKTRAEDTGGALGVLEGAFPYKGYGPAFHVHSREDEAIYVLEGQICFRVGDDEFVAGPGALVWQPRGVPQAFSVESDSARVLMIYTPGGLERMFEDGGVPAAE